ncbi:chromate efflux transporter [Kineococcus sp. GCM10028916]|uniref:chromate efflux transporter n=1 Tax=Kineococcus sp. GCM10028916 TaxID=3273394 RepID=UPI0036390B7F
MSASGERATSTTPEPPSAPEGSVREVFTSFLLLGLTSFGGPVAHLGYFREAFVVRRRWLGDRAYADLVALCQLLPGPASSQVGMALGLRRAGPLGMLAAWTAFTLPSALLLTAFALGVGAGGVDPGAGWLRGLSAAAVAVVAHAVLGMARTLAPDRLRATIAVLALVIAVLVPTAAGLVAAIGAGIVLALLLLRSDPPDASDPDAFTVPLRRRTGAVLLAVFAALLVLLPVAAAATGNAAVGLVDGSYRAGALVFGGGHVVLPLLDAETVQRGLVDRGDFLVGYGAAQAVPGPLFTFAAYLGAVRTAAPTGLAGAALSLVAIFAPSVLLVAGALPFWERLRRAPHVRRALAGASAAVVGLLGAALYDPVFTHGVTSPGTLAVAALAFVALSSWKAPAWAVVAGACLTGFVAW